MEHSTPGRSVSVVVPVHNGSLFLAQALDSILAQTLPPLEVIVVDDGSNDESGAIAESYGPPVRLLRQPKAGPAEARNTGIAAAVGRYLAFLDADDLWPPDKVASQVDALERSSSEMVFGMAVQFHDEPPSGPVRGRLEEGEPLPAMVAGGMLTRSETFRRVGPFSAQWRVGEFIDWYARAREMGLRSKVLPQVVLFRRLHDGNLGREDGTARLDFTRLLRASLARRRGEGIA